MKRKTLADKNFIFNSYITNNKRVNGLRLAQICIIYLDGWGKMSIWQPTFEQVRPGIIMMQHLQKLIYRLQSSSIFVTMAWASYQIRKIAGLRMRRECRERFPRYHLQRKPLVSDPGMHVPWCMSGSLTRGGGENASYSRNCLYW